MALNLKRDVATTRVRESLAGPQRPRPAAHRTGKLIGGGITLFVLLFGSAFLFLPGMMGYGNASDLSSATTERVTRGRLVVTVTEDGDLESASNVEVSCQVAGGGTIIWIIRDGSMVEAGQELVRLNQATIEDQLNAQKITFAKARATKIQADQDYASACIAVREYAEGTYDKELQTAEAQVQIAMENLRSAENILTHTDRMFRKGYVSALQIESDKFAVGRARLDLKAVNTAKRVLQEFTKPKMLKALQATRDAAEARTQSEQAAVNLEKDKLERLLAQLKFCVVKAPQRGMVVYANENDPWGGQNTVIRAGAVVREREALIRLPDLTKMQVKATVHESKVNLIRPGMPARITVQDRQWSGKVVSVANQPEPGGFFSASVKVYATIVSIEGDPAGLKPGMTSKAEIRVADIDNALTVPVSAVVQQNGEFFAWVKDKTGAHRRLLLLGQTNDKVIQITDGVKEGDEVILNPRAVIAEAQPGGTSPIAVENADRFGAPTPSAGTRPSVPDTKPSSSEPAKKNGAAGQAQA